MIEASLIDADSQQEGLGAKKKKKKKKRPVEEEPSLPEPNPEYQRHLEQQALEVAEQERKLREIEAKQMALEAEEERLKQQELIQQKKMDEEVKRQAKEK